jgi:hypothetical protein
MTYPRGKRAPLQGVAEYDGFELSIGSEFERIASFFWQGTEPLEREREREARTPWLRKYKTDNQIHF